MRAHARDGVDTTTTTSMFTMVMRFTSVSSTSLRLLAWNVQVVPVDCVASYLLVVYFHIDTTEVCNLCLCNLYGTASLMSPVPFSYSEATGIIPRSCHVTLTRCCFYCHRPDRLQTADHQLSVRNHIPLTFEEKIPLTDLCLIESSPLTFL